LGILDGFVLKAMKLNPFGFLYDKNMPGVKEKLKE
jgi:hypothetical protein